MKEAVAEFVSTKRQSRADLQLNAFNVVYKPKHIEQIRQLFFEVNSKLFMEYGEFIFIESHTSIRERNIPKLNCEAFINQKGVPDDT